jgi:hypothetical protein
VVARGPLVLRRWRGWAHAAVVVGVLSH